LETAVQRQRSGGARCGFRVYLRTSVKPTDAVPLFMMKSIALNHKKLSHYLPESSRKPAIMPEERP
jgi:hypothetical protein